MSTLRDRVGSSTGLGPTAVPLGIVYLGLGVTAALIGPSLPSLAETLGVTVASLSLVASALFGGLLAGVLVAAGVGDRVGDRSRLVVGAVVQSVALGGIPLIGSRNGVVASVALLGVGFGVSEVAGTFAVNRRAGRAANLTLLTAVFAAGALVTPLLVNLSLRTTGGLVLAFGVGALVQAGAMVSTLLWWPVGRPPEPAGPVSSGGRVIGVGVLVVVATYVGAEATLSTWASEAGRVLIGLSADAAAAVSTGFWAALLAGRLLGARVARRVDPDRLLVLSLAVAAVAAGVAALTASVVPGAAISSLVLACVAMGPVYGLTLATVPAAGPTLASVGLLIAVGGVGGVVVPGLATWSLALDGAGVTSVADLRRVLAWAAVFLALAAGVALSVMDIFVQPRNTVAMDKNVHND